MHPHKFKTISQPLAERHGLSSETVEKVARVYYREVQRRLSSLEHLGVDLPGLGVFYFKSQAAAIKMRKIRGLIETVKDLPGMKPFGIRTEQQESLDKLTKLMDKRDAEYLKRKNIRHLRYDKPDSSLEESRTDS